MWLFLFLAAAVAALRFYHATRMMAVTGDIIRHLYYGVLVGQIGFSAAGRPLDSFHGLSWVSWSGIPYNYPIVTLSFFSAVAAVWPSIFFGKLALTLIEGANTWLVYRYSRSRALALLYWAAPLSIWWVSREGQFEPLQNLCVLGALCLLGRAAPAAFLLLALGVQVKLTAVFLLPLFIVTIWRRDRRRLFPCLLAFLAGLLPTLLAQRAYPVLNAIQGNLGALHFNPYYWNPLDASWKGDWKPPLPWWLTLVNALATWPALLFCAWRLVKPRKSRTSLTLSSQHEMKIPPKGGTPELFSTERWEYLAPLLFLIALKTHSNVQFWYLILWPSFVLPISDRRVRWAMFLIYPLLDVTAASGLLGHLIGPKAWWFYQSISVWAGLH